MINASRMLKFKFFAILDISKADKQCSELNLAISSLDPAEVIGYFTFTERYTLSTTRECDCIPYLDPI